MTHTSGLPDMLPDNEKLRKAHKPSGRRFLFSLWTAALSTPLCPLLWSLREKAKAKRPKRR
jgi:hypothetical protein